MQSLAILIPIALALTALGIWAFLWAVKSEQYDDLDRAGRDILFDDDDSASARPFHIGASSSSSPKSYLVQCLEDEKNQAGLISSDRLPFYYYEIARALSPSSSKPTRSSLRKIKGGPPLPRY